MSNLSKLILSLVLVLFVEITAGLFTKTSVTTWYTTLNKPSWTPPNWTFPLVWTLLYFMIGFSLWLIWTKTTKSLLFVIFFIQLLLNFLWSPFFFILQNPFLGLLIIGALWLSIVSTMFIFYPISKTASLLLIPYLIWVTYASALNIYIWRYN